MAKMKANMEVLQGPLLEKVLGKLECCRDLLRCAAVSKLWLQLASRVQPTSLYLPYTWRRQQSLVTPQELLQVMQWLHRKQQAGYFSRLERFTLGIAAAAEEELAPACYQGDLLSAFMHSSLVYVSFWQLQALDLGGPVHLDTVLPVLPTALLDLTLRPYCKHMPIKCCLAPFKRFSQLTSLAIGLYDKSPAKHVKGSFVLDVCLPTLESLSLNPWPIEAHEDHPFAQSLPNVRILMAHVACNKAQSLVVLPSVELLGLISHDIAKSMKAFGTKIPSIKILTGSQLRKLHLVGPLATPFRLDLSERLDHLYVAHYDCGRVVLPYSSCVILSSLSCTVGMQSRMEALQGELLERILSNMQDTTGLLLQCSLVSKAWQQAVSRIYPRDLELPRTPDRRTPVTPEDVLQLMQWLQRKHSKGYFGQLETLTLLIAPAVDYNCSAACLQGDLLTAFLHSTVAYLNFWHLQALTIHGRLRMETILPILPTNLRHLCLEPDGSLMPQTVSLAAFAPYTLLETLGIAVNDVVTQETTHGSIILDSALPTLQNLTLDPWPFHVHKNHSCLVPA